MIKQSQGPLKVLFKGYREYSEPYSMNCLIDTENPTRWKKKLTTWPDCSHDISFHNSGTGLKEMGINGPWNWRLIILKIIKMTPVRAPLTNFKMTLRADCACKPSICLWKCLPTDCQWWREGTDLWTGVHPPAPPLPHQLPASNIKQSSHQPCLFIIFWVVSSRPLEGVLLLVIFSKGLKLNKIT